MRKQTLISMAVVFALAALASTAVVASAAEFKAESYPVTVRGAQMGTGTGGSPGESGTILAFEGQMTECGSGGFTGELTKSSSSLDVNQFGLSCSWFGVMTSNLAWNGCHYRLNVNSGSGDAFAGTVDFVCPEGAKIVLTAGNCEIQIGAQTGLSTVSYENLTKETPASGFRAVFNVQGFTYTKTKDGFFCPLNGTGVATDGVLVGGTKVLDIDEATPLDLWIE